jgi:hypothetical protein
MIEWKWLRFFSEKCSKERKKCSSLSPVWFSEVEKYETRIVSETLGIVYNFERLFIKHKGSQKVLQINLFLEEAGVFFSINNYSILKIDFFCQDLSRS